MSFQEQIDSYVRFAENKLKGNKSPVHTTFLSLIRSLKNKGHTNEKNRDGCLQTTKRKEDPECTECTEFTEFTEYRNHKKQKIIVDREESKNKEQVLLLQKVSLSEEENDAKDKKIKDLEKKIDELKTTNAEMKGLNSVNEQTLLYQSEKINSYVTQLQQNDFELAKIKAEVNYFKFFEEKATTDLKNARELIYQLEELIFTLTKMLR